MTHLLQVDRKISKPKSIYENEKLRAQVEGLKECVGLAVAQMLFPTMHSDRLMVVGRAIMEGLDVDALIASWRENFQAEEHF